MIDVGLDYPTSLALDPEHGQMYWSDAGASPKIEASFMDGYWRRSLVTDRIRHPTGLVVDYASDAHMIYWVDTKLNTIETIRPDGANRDIILRGEQLKHPLSMDIFENHLFWVTKDTGELIKQDKFGRGIPVSLAKNLQNPTGVKVYHKAKYNLTIPNPCRHSNCTHLCLLTQDNYQCKCPDNTQSRIVFSSTVCDSATEEPLPLPRACHCRNGGFCEEDDKGALYCSCPPQFVGDTCQNSVQWGKGPGASAAILIPFIVLLLLASAGAIYFVIRKRPFGKGPVLSSLTNSQSVSFRQGTNVEFGSPAFSSNGPSIPEPIDVEYNLSDINSKNRDFSNPMYDALGNLEAAPSDSNGTGGLYDDMRSGRAVIEPSTAVLAPSSITVGGRSPDRARSRHRDLDPSSLDTGKDTQKLVEEDKSDC